MAVELRLTDLVPWTIRDVNGISQAAQLVLCRGCRARGSLSPIEPIEIGAAWYRAFNNDASALGQVSFSGAAPTGVADTL